MRGWQRDLSVSHNKIGDVLVEQGNLTAALDAYNASLAIAEFASLRRTRKCRMAARPLVSHDRIGDVLRAQGNLTAALDAYRRLPVPSDERLAEADPG